MWFQVAIFHSYEVCAWDQFCILPRLFCIRIFHVILYCFKKKTSACGSHPDCPVGQWANRCDPLSTLAHTLTSCMFQISKSTEQDSKISRKVFSDFKRDLSLWFYSYSQPVIIAIHCYSGKSVQLYNIAN